jgi:hypothetical protein
MDTTGREKDGVIEKLIPRSSPPSPAPDSPSRQVPMLAPSVLEDFEPVSNDLATLRDQLVRLRALFIDTQRALFAAKADATSYERELMGLRWRSVTQRQPADVNVGQVSAALGEVTVTGDLMMRSPKASLDEYTNSHGAARTMHMLGASSSASTPRSGAYTPGTLYVRTSASGVMSSGSRIAEKYR